MFKEVGVPLKRIKQLLKGKTPEDIVAILKEKSFEIESKIKKLKHLQTIIQTKVKLTEQVLETDFSSVSLQYLDEEKFMISRKTLNLPERKYITAISELIHYGQLHELDEGYPVGGILAREQILKKDFYNYSYFFIKIQEGIEKINYHVRPKGLYAVGYQKGDEAEDAYRRIIRFIEKNGMQMGDYAYEEYMLDEVMVDRFENQITKILLQIKEEEEYDFPLA